MAEVEVVLLELVLVLIVVVVEAVAVVVVVVGVVWCMLYIIPIRSKMPGSRRLGRLNLKGWELRVIVMTVNKR